MHHCIVGISNSSNSTSTTLLLQSRRDVSRNVNDLDIISIPNSGIECNSVISNNDIDGSIKLISTVGKRKRKPGTYKKGVCVEQLLLVERRTHDFDDIKGDPFELKKDENWRCRCYWSALTLELLYSIHCWLDRLSVRTSFWLRFRASATANEDHNGRGASRACWRSLLCNLISAKGQKEHEYTMAFYFPHLLWRPPAGNSSDHGVSHDSLLTRFARDLHVCLQLNRFVPNILTVLDSRWSSSSSSSGRSQSSTSFGYWRIWDCSPENEPQLRARSLINSD